MHITERHLYSIGEVAQRTGLTVSAIRYYADEGLVDATELTPSGHRLYDVDAIARLELVRTLRDLESGLEQVRALLSGTSSLQDILAEHLELIERKTTELQGKRAVLRALVREQGSADRIRLLQKLVKLSDAERQRLVDDFHDQVTADLPVGACQWIRENRPRLSQDPTPGQLDAWIALAELLDDGEFREATRAYLRETYGEPSRASGPSRDIHEFVQWAGGNLPAVLIAAKQAGLAADDSIVVALAERFVESVADSFGVTPDDDLRCRLADGYGSLEAFTPEALLGPDYAATEGRYLRLVAAINDPTAPAAAPAATPGDSAEPDFRGLGKWLASAILATR